VPAAGKKKKDLKIKYKEQILRRMKRILRACGRHDKDVKNYIKSKTSFGL